MMPTLLTLPSHYALAGLAASDLAVALGSAIAVRKFARRADKRVLEVAAAPDKDAPVGRRETMVPMRATYAPAYLAPAE